MDADAANYYKPPVTVNHRLKTDVVLQCWYFSSILSKYTSRREIKWANDTFVC